MSKLLKIEPTLLVAQSSSKLLSKYKETLFIKKICLRGLGLMIPLNVIFILFMILKMKIAFTDPTGKSLFALNIWTPLLLCSLMLMSAFAMGLSRNTTILK